MFHVTLFNLSMPIRRTAERPLGAASVVAARGRIPYWSKTKVTAFFRASAVWLPVISSAASTAWHGCQLPEPLISHRFRIDRLTIDKCGDDAQQVISSFLVPVERNRNVVITKLLHSKEFYFYHLLFKYLRVGFSNLLSFSSHALS